MRPRNHKKKPKRRASPYGGPRTNVVPFSFAAPKTVVNLKFQKTYVMNNSAATTAGNYFIPTYLYDVDPLVGSTAVPGFSEWGGFYRQYRVLSSSIRITIANLEISPVSVYLGVYNIAPSATSNYVTPAAQVMLSQPTTHSVMVPPANTAQISLAARASTNQFAGALANSIDTYVGPTSGSNAPANNWFWLIGGRMPASSFANGVAIDCRITVRVEFFELATPST